MKEAQSFFPKFHSQLMKIVKTKIVSKKTASRKISRINKKITNSLKNK
jgi:ribosomal protein S20